MASSNNSKTNDKNIPELLVMAYPGSATKIYAIAPGATLLDVEFLLETKLSQLEAMLCMTYGVAADTLNQFCDGIKDSFHHACADMATEVKELTRAAMEMRIEEARNGVAA